MTITNAYDAHINTMQNYLDGMEKSETLQEKKGNVHPHERDSNYKKKQIKTPKLISISHTSISASIKLSSKIDDLCGVGEGKKIIGFG